MLSMYYKECLQAALSELRRFAGKKINPLTMDFLLSDLELYLKSRDIGHIFKEGYEEKAPQYVSISYDIPVWLSSGFEDASVEDYKGAFSYFITVTDYMRNRLKDFRQINRNPELSMQVLYRDGYIKDFWPLWVRKE
jgi:hypothetical protein